MSIIICNALNDKYDKPNIPNIEPPISTLNLFRNIGTRESITNSHKIGLLFILFSMIGKSFTSASCHNTKSDTYKSFVGVLKIKSTKNSVTTAS